MSSNDFTSIPSIPHWLTLLKSDSLYPSLAFVFFFYFSFTQSHHHSSIPFVHSIFFIVSLGIFYQSPSPISICIFHRANLLRYRLPIFQSFLLHCALGKGSKSTKYYRPTWQKLSHHTNTHTIYTEGRAQSRCG